MSVSLLLSCLLALASLVSAQTPPTCSSTLSAVPVPSPYYELNFNSDPTTAGVSSFTYLASDTSDSSANQGFHKGLVSLAGNNAVSYINMSASAGSPYWGGAYLQQPIGGPSAGSLTSGTYGWSYEVVFKATAQVTWGKIIDIGNSNINGCHDDIVLSWNSNTFGFQADYCSSGTPASANAAVGAGVESPFYPQYQIPLNQWVHAVFVFQALITPASTASSAANYLLYINGQMAPSQGYGGPYPPAVYRQNPSLGRSDWGDRWWQGLIDDFSIYNYALQGNQAQALYQYRMAACSLTTGASSSSYPAAPSMATGSVTPKQVVYNTNNPTSVCGGTCAYGYLASDPEDASCGLSTVHTQLLDLYGSQTPTQYQPYINLTATSGPNAISSTPVIQVGGVSSGSLAQGTYGWSYELMFKPHIVETWAKLMDLSAPQTSDGHCHHDIITGWVFDGPTWSFSTCDYDNYQYSIQVMAVVPIYTWIHLVLVTQQDATNTNTSYYYSYVNGQLTGYSAGQWYPAGAYRQNGFMARSEWSADYYWNGEVDFFNIYDVAVSQPQALALYNGATNNGQAAGSCVSSSVGNTATTIDPSWRVFEATFNADPRAAAGGAATANYGWVNADGNDTSANQAQHQGLIYLAGGASAGTSAVGGNYVNLSASAGPQSIGGTPLPELLIGAITPGTSPINGTAGWAFEVVFKATGQQPWAKVFDIGNFQPNNNQQCSEDIVFGWNGNVNNQMGFQVCDQANNAQGAQPAFTTPILNVWHHMIANIVLQSNGLAVYQVWLDGQVQSTTSFTTWIWPQYVQRTNALLGRSNWNDNYWQGFIDYFAIYNRALDTAQIQNQYYTNMLAKIPQSSGVGSCSLTSTAVPAAWYELTFAASPLSAAGITASQASYTWTQGSDVIDQATGLSQYHSGILTLPGSTSGTGPFVNLTSPTGTPQSIGQPLPGYIGGATTNGGDITKGTYGWSFEVTFKPTAQETWAKLFDIGNPQVNGVCRDDLLFGWVSNTQAFSFTYCDGTGFQYTAFPWFQATLDQWYHVVVSIQRLMDSDGTMSNAANYFVYINGQQLTGSGAGGPYPNAINRANADLGRSDWNDNFFAAEIDTFRIYNSALTMTQAQALYQNANGGCSLSRGGTTSNTATLEWLTPSRDTGAVKAPVFSMGTATTDPRTQNGVTYAYNWTQSDSYDQSCGISAYRTGLIVMPGLDQQNNLNGPFINLSTSTGANTIGQVMPNIGGQSSGTQSTVGAATGTAGWSFEYMVKPATVETWAKLFDLGQPQTSDGACHDDIISGWFSDGPYWSFSTCDPQNTQYAINNALGPVYLDTWVHAVMVIQQSPTNSSSANYFSYVNGHLQSAYSTAWYPRSVYRANALIARSDWSSDYYWAGEIDFFNIYDVAITAPQALQLYNSATNNGQLLKTCAALGDYTATINNNWLIFSETFTDDPRLRAGGPGIAGANYSWVASDPTDSAAMKQYHSGLLTLAGGPGGSYAQWVNLSASSGPNSIVNTLNTAFIGGLGSGYALAGTAGFSIEIVFKPTSQQTWGKLIDFGPSSGTCYYDIVFGWQASSATAMTWSACDQFNTEYPTVSNYRVAANNIQVGTWIHAVLIAKQTLSGGSGEFITYINGVMTQDQIDAYYPQNFPRPNAGIGRSEWGDAYWQGEVDSIRIYNRVLNQWQVGTLYTAATGQASPAGSPPALCNGVPCTSSSSSSTASSNTGGGGGVASSSAGGGGGGSSGSSSTTTSGGSSGLSGGAIAGIVIGSVVGALLLLVILFFLCCGAARGKKSSNTDESSSRANHRFGEMEPSRSGVELSQVQGETTETH